MLPILAILTTCDWDRRGQTGMLVSGRSHILYIYIGLRLIGRMVNSAVAWLTSFLLK